MLEIIYPIIMIVFVVLICIYALKESDSGFDKAVSVFILIGLLVMGVSYVFNITKNDTATTEDSMNHPSTTQSAQSDSDETTESQYFELQRINHPSTTQSVQSDNNETTALQEYEFQNDYIYDEANINDSQFIYDTSDNRKRYSILSDPSDYERSSTEEKPHYIYANLDELVYNGLDASLIEIMSYKGKTKKPNFVGRADYGVRSLYYTYFDSIDSNRYLLFTASGDEFFGDDDYCYGAAGWLDRIFDYEKTQGLCTAKDFANVLNARNTYVLYDLSGINFVPSNLSTNCLFVIEADISTARGIKPCVVYLEAESDEYCLGIDTWVQVLIN